MAPRKTNNNSPKKPVSRKRVVLEKKPLKTPTTIKLKIQTQKPDPDSSTPKLTEKQLLAQKKLELANEVALAQLNKNAVILDNVTTTEPEKKKTKCKKNTRTTPLSKPRTRKKIQKTVSTFFNDIAEAEPAVTTKQSPKKIIKKTPAPKKRKTEIKSADSTVSKRRRPPQKSEKKTVSEVSRNLRSKKRAEADNVVRAAPVTSRTSSGASSTPSWTRDISSSSTTTCVTVGDFVRIDQRIPVLQLPDIIAQQLISTPGTARDPRSSPAPPPAPAPVPTPHPPPDRATDPAHNPSSDSGSSSSSTSSSSSSSSSSTTGSRPASPSRAVPPSPPVPAPDFLNLSQSSLERIEEPAAPSPSERDALIRELLEAQKESERAYDLLMDRYARVSASQARTSSSDSDDGIARHFNDLYLENMFDNVLLECNRVRQILRGEDVEEADGDVEVDEPMSPQAGPSGLVVVNGVADAGHDNEGGNYDDDEVSTNNNYTHFDRSPDDEISTNNNYTHIDRSINNNYTHFDRSPEDEVSTNNNYTHFDRSPDDEISTNNNYTHFDRSLDDEVSTNNNYTHFDRSPDDEVSTDNNYTHNDRSTNNNYTHVDRSPDDEVLTNNNYTHIDGSTNNNYTRFDRSAEDEDAISLFAESMFTDCGSSRRDEYVPRPVAVSAAARSYHPTPIAAGTRPPSAFSPPSKPISAHAPAAAPSSSPGSGGPPLLLAVLYQPIHCTKSAVFHGVCFYNIVQGGCRNHNCRYPHVEVAMEEVERRLAALSEVDFIQEYLLLRAWALLRRKYGTRFLREAERRDLTRVVLEMAMDFTMRARAGSLEDSQQRQEALEAALTRLSCDTDGVRACADLLRLPVAVVEGGSRPLHLLLLDALAVTANFSRFKRAFIELAALVVAVGERLDSAPVAKILERVCILPYEERSVRAMLSLVRLTDAAALAPLMPQFVSLVAALPNEPTAEPSPPPAPLADTQFTITKPIIKRTVDYNDHRVRGHPRQYRGQWGHPRRRGRGHPRPGYRYSLPSRTFMQVPRPNFFNPN